MIYPPHFRTSIRLKLLLQFGCSKPLALHLGGHCDTHSVIFCCFLVFEPPQGQGDCDNAWDHSLCPGHPTACPKSLFWRLLWELQMTVKNRLGRGFWCCSKGLLVWSEVANHPNHSNPSINTNAHGTRPKSIPLYGGIHHLKGYGWFLPLCHLAIFWIVLVDLNCGVAEVRSHIKLAPCSDCPTASLMASGQHAQFCAHAPRVRELLSHVFPLPITTMTRRKAIEKSGWVRSF